jgi:glycerol-3-phosphate acyltransferase PlsY
MEKQVILNEKQFELTLNRLCYQLIENHNQFEDTVLIGLQPFAALLCFLVFLLIFVFSKYVSLGAIISAMIYPFIVYYVDPKVLFHEMVFTVILSSAVIFTHRKNISRLLKGEENKMNLLRKKA